MLRFYYSLTTVINLYIVYDNELLIGPYTINNNNIIVNTVLSIHIDRSTLHDQYH